jgi:maltose/moltooligosaccharide transporter
MSQSTDTKSQSSKIWTVGTLTYTSVGIAFLFLWLFWGDFAWSMKDRAVGPVAALMVKSYGISDFYYGLLIISFPQLTNIILGPIVSFYSDRHRGRFGRRIPFLAFTVPFIVAGMLGIAFTSGLAHHVQGFIGAENISINTASLIVFGCFWIIFDFGNTLAFSIFYALVNDVVPSAFLGRFFGLFRAISLGAGIFFNYFLLGHAEKQSMWIFLGLAVFYTIGFSLLLFKIKEGEYEPIEEKSGASPNILTILKIYSKECFSLPYYRLILVAIPLAGTAIIPFNAYALFHAKSLNIPMDHLGKYYAYTYVISFVLSYFLGVLADKYHPIRTGIAAIALYGVLAFTGAFFITDELSFSIVFILHGIFSGCFITLTASYGPRLFPRALFAQFNSAMWILQSLAWAVATPLIGKFLDYTHNNYNYTLLIGGFFSIIGAVVLCFVYKSFIKLGGDKQYQAPDVTRL